jgi:hypothetical protein
MAAFTLVGVPPPFTGGALPPPSPPQLATASANSKDALTRAHDFITFDLLDQMELARLQAGPERARLILVNQCCAKMLLERPQSVDPDRIAIELPQAAA